MAETASSAFGLSLSQANGSEEFPRRRNTTYSFDEPMSFTPLSPPPPRKPIIRAKSTVTL